jgi:hypothetical protein
MYGLISVSVKNAVSESDGPFGIVSLVGLCECWLLLSLQSYTNVHLHKILCR